LLLILASSGPLEHGEEGSIIVVFIFGSGNCSFIRVIASILAQKVSERRSRLSGVVVELFALSSTCALLLLHETPSGETLTGRNNGTLAIKRLIKVSCARR
jgi:hypothetical protein